MATQIESTGQLERKLQMAVPVAEVNREVETRLRKLARTLKMPGFRPGKVPLKMVQQSYGPQVHAEVLGDAVTKAFGSAVDEHKLRVAGRPRIEGREDAGEDQLGFTATFEVYPEVELGDVSALEIERGRTEVGDAEVAKTIEILRKQRVVWEPVERAPQDGDRVTIDFTGTLEGEAFEGSTATDLPFVLGEGRMLADFESGVRGMTPGETKSFPVTFPTDYSSTELAGKTAQFEATLKKVEAPKLPEVDSEFAKALGVPDGDLDRMRTDIRANLQREVTQRVNARNKANVLEALVGLAAFELPQALVDAESAQLLERAINDLKSRGVDVKQLPQLPPDTFKEQAQRRVRLGLIVSEAVREHGLAAKPDQIRKQIEDMAQAYENPGEVVRYYYSNRDRLAEIEALVVEQNVVDWALSKARVTEREVPFDELMAQQRRAFSEPQRSGRVLHDDQDTA